MKIPVGSMRCLLLCVIVQCCNASYATDCYLGEVRGHVLHQFAEFGPLSRHNEYFGFIYRADGEIRSAVVRGPSCRWTDICGVATRPAADRIPRGAEVLGEWHTHPHVTGVAGLSEADVQGANDNRHIRCYRAFYSTANGDILSWDPGERAVPSAMASRVRLGNYRTPPLATMVVASH